MGFHKIGSIDMFDISEFVIWYDKKRGTKIIKIDV